MLLEVEHERANNGQGAFNTINGAAIGGIFNGLVGAGNPNPLSCALIKAFCLQVLDNATTN